MTIFRACIALLLVIVATWLGIVLSWDAGYVAIGIQGWNIEMSLAVAAMSLLVLGLCCYLVLKLVRMFTTGNRNVVRWFQSKRATQVNRFTLQAIEAETNGDTVEAIRLLEAAGRDSQNPVLYLLRGSELATRIGAIEKAEALRNEAIETCGDQTPAFSKLSAGLAALESGNVKKGVIQLKRLLEEQPNCAPALSALIKHSLEQEDWVTALAYVDVLARLSYASVDEIESRRLASWAGRLREAEPSLLAKLWRQVPKRLRKDERLHSIYEAAVASATTVGP